VELALVPIGAGAQRQDIFHRKLKRAPHSGKNSKHVAAGALDWDSTVSIFKKFPPKPQLHEPQGYDTEAAESRNSPAPLTQQTTYAETQKSENSTRKRNFKSK
jgi:hypothetical protein